jgi:hypothetical protein
MSDEIDRLKAEEAGDLLDNMPEAVAMRRAREARAEATTRKGRTAEKDPADARRSTRRRLIVGAVLGLGAAARVLERAGGAWRLSR